MKKECLGRTILIKDGTLITFNLVLLLTYKILKSRRSVFTTPILDHFGVVIIVQRTLSLMESDTSTKEVHQKHP